MRRGKKLGAILLTMATVCCLAGCGNSEAKGGGSETIYIYGEEAPNETGAETDYDLYQLTLFEDGTYQMVKTEAAYGYGMLLGSSAITAEGTYEDKEATDGLIPCKLKADRIIYNSYSDMGGYNITIDTKDAAYPVEMPGNNMVEEEEFRQMYGDMTVYLVEDTNAFSMTAE